MLKPEDLKLGSKFNVDLKQLEKEIDINMLFNHKYYNTPYEKAVIDGEYSEEVRTEICKRYKEAGWNYVYHCTTSEKGKRYGLTCFIFSEKEIPIKYLEDLKGYKLVN